MYVHVVLKWFSAHIYNHSYQWFSLPTTYSCFLMICFHLYLGGIVALGKFDALHIGHRELAIEASKIGTPFLLSFVGMEEVLGWPSRYSIMSLNIKPLSLTHGMSFHFFFFFFWAETIT